ncbi:hypothetical protein BpHYR1_000037 [Brachionus plicatilis]|uniref:Uncharacterized protein n=1 Tax=Brachionus plicatilis TaxID=10195 RepID=A0A3M7QJJ0_BRAPC|nr:hypothetical protein BpHYR1_000037 [Brachionus plicatilis]
MSLKIFLQTVSANTNFVPNPILVSNKALPTFPGPATRQTDREMAGQLSAKIKTDREVPGQLTDRP